jgi:glycosyltransferase involved in cell wall biosynthesis
VSASHEAVIDARWLRTGIGRYILTLLKELKHKLPDTLLTCITMPEHVAAIAPHCDRVIAMNCGIYSVIEQARLPLIARGASVFCAPHYNVPVLRAGSLVVTIHDLTHIIFAAYRSKLQARLYAEPMLRLACTRAAHVVTPSQYTRQMLIERLHADPQKISVIPCAVSDVFRPQVKSEAAWKVCEYHGISTPYILFVGSTAPHKNLITLLRAYRHLSAKLRDVPALVLVLPQKQPASSTDGDLLSRLATPGVRCLHTVEDDSLAALYCAALMTVVPSFEEGFGLPVIESMACGTPVACSRAASLSEIADNDAIYFAPDSVEEMSSVIERMLFSDELQRQLAVGGLKRATGYSAGRSAAAYASMLNSIIGAHTRSAVSQ